MTRPPDLTTPSERQKIADRAEVSPRTVVRAHDEPEKVGDELKQRIERAREDLGFGRLPDAFFGLVMPDDGNPFFFQLKRAIQSRLRQTNHELVPASSYGIEQHEYATIQSWIALKVSGIFYAQNPPYERSLEALARAAGIAVVLVDVDPEKAHINLDEFGWHAVLANNRAGIERAVAHLVVENGHERIGFLAGPEDSSTAAARRAAFEQAIIDNQVDHHVVLTGDYSFQSGRKAAIDLARAFKKAPDECPTAIVAANDLMAIGLETGLQRNRLAVPDDFSIVGFDNIEQCQWPTPELTSVDQRIDDIAERAVRLMSEQISRVKDRDEPLGPVKPDLVTPELVERKSVHPRG